MLSYSSARIFQGEGTKLLKELNAPHDGHQVQFVSSYLLVVVAQDQLASASGTPFLDHANALPNWL